MLRKEISFIVIFCTTLVFMTSDSSYAAGEELNREQIEQIQDNAMVKEKFIAIQAKIFRKISEEISKRSQVEDSADESYLQSGIVAKSILQLRLETSSQYLADKIELFIDGVSWGHLQLSPRGENVDSVFWNTLVIRNIPRGMRTLRFEVSYSLRSHNLSVIFPSFERLRSSGDESIFMSEENQEFSFSLDLAHHSWNSAPHLIVKKWIEKK